jgi:parvulin-like peptidyl-prolyl isomerase
MWIAFPRCKSALTVGLLIGATLLGGCSQRMAAKVNDEVLTQDQFYTRCMNLTQMDPSQGPQTVGLMVLKQSIVDMLMEQEAKRLKLLPTDAEVNAELANARKQAASGGPSLEEQIKHVGLNVDALKDLFRRQLIQRKLFTQGVAVTDKDIEEFYNQNKLSPQFTTPERVEARQITVANEDAAKEVKRTLGKNADFRLVASSKSIDQFKESGGALPPLLRGYPDNPNVNKAVSSAAFKTPAGKITEPIKVGNNWVILKVEKKTAQQTKALPEVKEDIRQQMLQQKAIQSGQAMKVQQRITELRRDANVQIGLDQYKDAIAQQQEQLKQAPAPGITPTLPGGR